MALGRFGSNRTTTVDGASSLSKRVQGRVPARRRPLFTSSLNPFLHISLRRFFDGFKGPSPLHARPYRHPGPTGAAHRCSDHQTGLAGRLRQHGAHDGQARRYTPGTGNCREPSFRDCCSCAPAGERQKRHHDPPHRRAALQSANSRDSQKETAKAALMLVKHSPAHACWHCSNG
jgi:hypothetical protein